MTRQLVLIHGRSQEHRDSVALKAEWLDALAEGLAKSNLTLPIGEQEVRFPFYGDTLYDMVDGHTTDTATSVIVRGENADDDEGRFTQSMLEEIRQTVGITETQIAAVAGQDVVQKGPLNWEWLHAILKAIDQFVPHGSGASISLFTHDVYQYLKNSNIRETIEVGLSGALAPGVECVVVSHSLGTVVAYNLLRREGHLRGWKVPLFVTLGSPLAVGAIRKTLKSFAPIRCPECVSCWFNALDERDLVALYPLTTAAFPLDPQKPDIENKDDVRNRTGDRHGIGGYLDDKEVAKRIYDALTSRHMRSM
jgi:hypothetical protein